MPPSPNALLQQFVVITGQDKGSVFPLPESGTFRIGRSKETDTHLNDAAVSRNHCQVILRAGQLRVLDQQSHLGTFVNGQRITEHTLRPGDVLRVGDTELRLESAAFDEAATRGALPEHIRQAAQIASAAAHRSAAADMRTSEIRRDPVVTAPGVKGSRSAGLLYVAVALLFLVGVGVGTAWWQGYLPGMAPAQFRSLTESEPGSPPSTSQGSLAETNKEIQPSPTPLPSEPSKPILVFEDGGHLSGIRGVVFTPDGQSVISASWDKTIRIWDVATGQSTRVLRPPIGKGRLGRLYGLAIAPDGQLLAASGYFSLGGKNPASNAILLIHWSTGRIERVLLGHTNMISHLAFSSDGKTLASGSADRTVRLWDVATGKNGLVLEGHKAGIDSLCFSPDGKRLVTGSSDGLANIWTVSTGRADTDLPGHTAEVRVAWSPDGETVVTGDVAQNWRIWNTNGTLRQRFEKVGASLVPANAFTPDSRSLLGAAHLEGKMIDLATGTVRATGPKHANTVGYCAVSPDGRVAAAGDLKGAVILWRVADGKKVAILEGASKPVYAVGWSKDGQGIAWGNSINGNNLNGSLRPLVRSFSLSQLDYDTVPDASFVRARFRDEMIQIEVKEPFSNSPRVLVKNGDRVVTEFKANGQVYCCSLLPNNRVVVGGHNLVVYDTRDGKKLHQFTDGSGSDVALSPDQRYLLVAGSPIQVYPLDSTTPLLSLFVSGDEWIAWTPQGYYAASAGGEKLMGWQMNNGFNQLATFYPASQFRKTFYRPDVIQRLLAAGSLEKALTATDEVAGKHSRRNEVVDVLPPKVVITSPKQSGLRLSDKTLEVEATAASLGAHPVTALRLFLDGRPAPEGLKHFPTPQPGKVRAAWTIEVPPGSHRLSVQATSSVSKGVSDEVEVSFTSATPAADKTPTSTLYVLAIGINAYPGKLKLDAAVPDAQDITHAFERYSNGLFRDVKTKLLLDKQATRREILIGLNWLQKEAKTGDVVVVFYAGHGDSQQAGEFHLLPIDVDPKNLARSGVSGETLKSKLGNLPCTTLMILDACFSGSFSEGKKKKRSLPTGADNLVREFIYDAGLVVMCGAAKEQEAAEENGHGLFTRALVEALSGKAPKDENGLVDLDAVQLYVARQVRKLSDGEQEPTIHRPSTVRSFALSKP